MTHAQLKGLSPQLTRTSKWGGKAELTTVEGGKLTVTGSGKDLVIINKKGRADKWLMPN